LAKLVWSDQFMQMRQAFAYCIFISVYREQTQR
jgi:hypothetical protein